MSRLRSNAVQWRDCVAVLVVVALFRLCGCDVEVLVHANKPVRTLNHFWRSTGFCPPQPHSLSHLYDLSRDQQLNLALIGSVPHQGLKQVRIHWMLELVSARLLDGEYHYNFTYLDQLMELLLRNDLQPGFELMGSVSNTFTDFEDEAQVAEWRKLVHLIATRYIEKYGLDVVSEWNFETWNEPNNHDFDNVSMTIQGFLNYYDACLEGLRAASERLRLGGPGDACHTAPHSPYCWALLQHCYNTLTLKHSHSIHYIALHKKGGGGTLPILQQLVETVEEIQQKFPLFRSLPVYNDEADPLVGWNKPLDWRADVTYAAMVTKVISQHQELLVNSTVNFTLLSNDNAFLSFYPHQFTQRTLTARFQINNTHPAHVQLLRKPALTAMALLARLGEQQVQVSMVTQDPQEESSVGVLSSVHTPQQHTHTHTRSADSWNCAVLLYNCRDNATTNQTDTITLNITGAPAGADLVYMKHYMDNRVSNPYEVWKQMGSPDYPNLQQLHQLRNQEEAQADGPVPVPDQGGLTLKVKLPVPSLLLIHLCARPSLPPGQVEDLHFLSITEAQLLLVWRDRSIRTKCVKTYEVEFSKEGVTFQRINFRDTIFTSHTFSPESGEVCGWYRVRAVDFWGRAGEFSPAEKYTELC